MAENKIRNEGGSSSSSSRGNNRGESIVVNVGRRRSSCGYCKSGGHTSISHGLWADSLTVDDYQALLDRGWRRSGCFLYKPEMERTCCPSYTIRLKGSDFVPSKELIRASKRMEKFLDGTLDVKKRDEFMNGLNNCKVSCISSHDEIKSSAARTESAGDDEETKKDEQFMHYLSDQIGKAVLACTENGDFPYHIQLPTVSVKKVVQAKRKLLVEGSEDLLYSSNVSFQIAAALRRAEKDVHNAKLSEDIMGENGRPLELTPKGIAEILTSSLNQMGEIPYPLSIRACNGYINIYSATKQTCLNQEVDKVTVSKESPTGSGSKSKRNCWKKRCERPQVKRRKLEIRLKRSSFDPEEFALYRRYQLKVHNDSPDRVTESSYRGFLVNTPLVFVPSAGDGKVPPCGFGSFHQQYVIDGRLVAVGVIDILPKCVSSKYLFWDPDLAFLSLGKYSALQEIEWVKENQFHCPTLEYYYLGYYIHSCTKMRYKAAYCPSELLCPLRYQWVPFDIARPLLDRNPYVVLSDFASSQNVDSSAPVVLENHMDLQHWNSGEEDMNDVPIDGDEEMDEIDSEDSDDESGPETSGLASVGADGDIGNILMGLKGSRPRYKDLQIAFGFAERNYLETQLHRYVKAVGVELSERMVYSLG